MFVSAALVGLTALPAHTAVPAKKAPLSSFNWSAKFQIGFYTRTYTARSEGTHKFTTDGVKNRSGSSAANCSRGAVIQVTMYAEASPSDDRIGSTRTLNCKRGGTATWTNVSPDTFYYYVKVTGNYETGGEYSRRLDGTVTYP